MLSRLRVQMGKSDVRVREEGVGRELVLNMEWKRVD